MSEHADAGPTLEAPVVTLIFLGLVGGLITGISPCILPVLPVIFLSGGAQGARTTAPGALESRGIGSRPFLVVAGLALSFSVITLLGTLALSALPVPEDVIHWLGLIVLVLLGIGMIVPAFERILEKPFARLPQRQVSTDRGGFVLGLTLGAVYVPCAGPVLAAITVAGATGRIGGSTIVLTLAFAVGTAIPLLFFALAGRRVAERVRAFRSKQRAIRVGAGVVVIGLAVALTFNATDAVQRAIPDYTSALNSAFSRSDTSALAKTAAGTKSSASKLLAACESEAQVMQVTSLRSCGPAPKIAGVTGWFNTANGQPVTAADLEGKVVLVDFWAYSCINCQRAIPHVEAWYKNYSANDFIVIGIHTPEYAFEHVAANVRAGAQRLGITYPVAQDNDYTTWNAFSNSSWPADYLIDATGMVRHVSVGEGAYPQTETMIRALLQDAHPGVSLPPATDVADTTPTDSDQTPETYLGSTRAQNYGGSGSLTNGTRAYSAPQGLEANTFGLGGTWKIGGEDLTSVAGSTLGLAYTASKVYLDVGGTGTITATVGGVSTTYDVSGAPNIYTVVDGSSVSTGDLSITLSPGLNVYSFTFG